ncbi:hypothetical protein DBT46_003840, partial [Aerococcus mictus]|uniref:hypothetical protein n=1 Tax=Aerococcus mictus TaxID=2976810 RepID=UPI002FD51001
PLATKASANPTIIEPVAQIYGLILSFEERLAGQSLLKISKEIAFHICIIRSVVIDQINDV